MDVKTVLHDAEDKMKKSLDSFQQHLNNVRSGRAHAGMVEDIRVDYYGTQTPLKQMANISVPEPKLLVINPWDVSALKLIEKALLESNLGITPVVDGKIVRLAVPTLTRERKDELVKIVGKVAEESRVSLRSIRREANEKAKLLEKEKKISEDESFKLQGDIQKNTDRYIQMVDQAQAAKDKELQS